MPDVINEYQKWKQQGEDLRIQAKHAMETRFRDLLSEAVRIAEEYRADFGGALKPPPAVTAFRYKAAARLKSKKAAGKSNPRRPPNAPRRRPSRRPPSPIPRWRTAEAPGHRQKETGRRQGGRRHYASLRRQGLRDRRRTAAGVTGLGGQTGDRQRISGKVRRKFMSVPV